MKRIIRFKTHLIILLIGLLGLTACKPGDSVVRHVATDIEITYQREGGIAGITQKWVIFPDGRVIGPGEQEMAVPPQEVMALLTKASAMDASPLQESTIAENACCDQFTYTLIVKVGDQETKIQTSDGVEQPEQLASLFIDIEELISKAEPIK